MSTSFSISFSSKFRNIFRLGSSIAFITLSDALPPSLYMAASSDAYVIQTQLAQPLIQQSVGGSGIAMSAVLPAVSMSTASPAATVWFEGASEEVVLAESEEWLGNGSFVGLSVGGLG